MYFSPYTIRFNKSRRMTKARLYGAYGTQERFIHGFDGET